MAADAMFWGGRKGFPEVQSPPTYGPKTRKCCFEYGVSNPCENGIFGPFDLDFPRWVPTSRAQGPTHPRPPIPEIWLSPFGIKMRAPFGGKITPSPQSRSTVQGSRCSIYAEKYALVQPPAWYPKSIGRKSGVAASKNWKA